MKESAYDPPINPSRRRDGRTRRRNERRRNKIVPRIKRVGERGMVKDVKWNGRMMRSDEEARNKEKKRETIV